MTLLRLVADYDWPTIESFSCCSEGAPPFQLEVQQFVQDLRGWLNDDAGVNREVFVLEETGETLGVAAHEDDDEGRFINAIAVEASRHNIGLGKLLLGSILADLAADDSCEFATWLVHPANFASHKMSARLGAEPIWPPEDKPLTRYVISW